MRGMRGEGGLSCCYLAHKKFHTVPHVIPRKSKVLKKTPLLQKNNRNIDRIWSRLCIQHLKPNGAGVGKIFENYEVVGITNIWLNIVVFAQSYIQHST